MEAVLESAVKRGVDLVLIQEPRDGREKDGTLSHPSFTSIRGDEGVPAKCWIAINRSPRAKVTELKNLTRGSGNYVQVVDVFPPGGEAIIIANVYDQGEGSVAIRPVQGAAWTEIARHRRVIVAGDTNAHSKMWNPMVTRNRNHAFWEQLINEENLLVWNTEEATRMGSGMEIHSTIDLTLSSPNMELNWCLLGEEATGSDHELIVWEVLGTPDPWMTQAWKRRGGTSADGTPRRKVRTKRRRRRRKGEKGRGNATSGWWTEHPFSPMAAGPRRW